MADTHKNFYLWLRRAIPGNLLTVIDCCKILCGRTNLVWPCPQTHSQRSGLVFIIYYIIYFNFSLFNNYIIYFIIYLNFHYLIIVLFIIQLILLCIYFYLLFSYYLFIFYIFFHKFYICILFFLYFFVVLIIYWRASETLSGVTQLQIRDICLCGRTYVILYFNPLYFCVSMLFDPVPNFSKWSLLVYRSLPASPWQLNCIR